MGVTVTVAVTGAVPAFTPLNAAIFPFPDAARPIVASLFVQAYVVPVTGPPKVMAVVEAPLHTVWSFIGSTDGVGFTVMSNVLVGPVHPLAVGVTVTVAVTGAVPVFTPLKAAMFPFSKRPIQWWRHCLSMRRWFPPPVRQR